MQVLLHAFAYESKILSKQLFKKPLLNILLNFFSFHTEV